MRSKLLLPTFCEKDTPAGKAPQCHLFVNKSSRRDHLINIYEPVKVYKRKAVWFFFHVDGLTKWWPFIRNVLSLRKFLMHSSRMNCSVHQRSTFEQIPVHRQHHDRSPLSFLSSSSSSLQSRLLAPSLPSQSWPRKVKRWKDFAVALQKKKIRLVWLLEPSSKCVLFWFFSIQLLKKTYPEPWNYSFVSVSCSKSPV